MERQSSHFIERADILNIVGFTHRYLRRFGMIDNGLNVGSQSFDERAHGVSDIPVAAIDQTNVLRRRRISQVKNLDVFIVKIIQQQSRQNTGANSALHHLKEGG